MHVLGLVCTYHLGTHTLVRVGVLAKEVSPWEGNFFHPIMPLMVSCNRAYDMYMYQNHFL